MCLLSNWLFLVSTFTVLYLNEATLWMTIMTKYWYLKYISKTRFPIASHSIRSWLYWAPATTKRKTWALGSHYRDVSVCKQVGRAANEVRVGVVFFFLLAWLRKKVLH